MPTTWSCLFLLPPSSVYSRKSTTLFVLLRTELKTTSSSFLRTRLCIYLSSPRLFRRGGRSRGISNSSSQQRSHSRHRNPLPSFLETSCHLHLQQSFVSSATGDRGRDWIGESSRSVWRFIYRAIFLPVLYYGGEIWGLISGLDWADRQLRRSQRLVLLTDIGAYRTTSLTVTYLLQGLCFLGVRVIFFAESQCDHEVLSGVKADFLLTPVTLTTTFL